MTITRYHQLEKRSHTAISFPAFSGLFPTLIAAAAAAPEEIPTW